MRFRAGSRSVGRQCLLGLAHDSFNTAQENDLLLENIEALAVGEESGTLKYLNFHEKCVDEFGVPMDLSYAWRVISIEGATECHQHDCKKCNGQ